MTNIFFINDKFLGLNSIPADGRSLSVNEIDQLQSQGNWSLDWNLVRYNGRDLDNGFLTKIRGCSFVGNVIFHDFDTTVKIKDTGDFILPSGLYDSTLAEVFVGNGVLIKGCNFVHSSVFEDGAVLIGCGNVTSNGETLFGNEQSISIGPEIGGREVPVCIMSSMSNVISVALSHGHYSDRDRKYIASLGDFRLKYKSRYNIIKSGAYLVSCKKVINVYIGEHAIVENSELDTVSVLSSCEEPTMISGALSIKNSLLQMGCQAGNGASILNCLLMEHSSVNLHAKVSSTILAPDSHISAGECHNSLVGPFVGFHHQSLLIAAVWPLGRGNLGYGCNVGSNHTGRQADQEIWIGEGIFFGLASVLKFPINLIEAPYTIIGSGVTCLPQRMAFPFSLINAPTISADVNITSQPPVGFNQLHPGWVLTHSMYTIARHESKYSNRSKAKRTRLNWNIFRRSTVELMLNARKYLLAVDGIDGALNRIYYGSDEIQGLGKNFMTEIARQQGKEIYTLHIRHYALSVVLELLEKDNACNFQVEIEHVQRLCIAEELDSIPTITAEDVVNIFEMNSSDDDSEQHFRLALLCHEYGNNFFTAIPYLLDELIYAAHKIAKSIEACKMRDDERGSRVIPGYADAHINAADDAVVKNAWEKYDALKVRVGAIKLIL